MKKKNLVKHYFALVAMLFVVSGSFVSNVMAADVDYQVICSGNTVKLVALPDVSSITETFSGKSSILKKVYPSFISNKTASNFYSQAPPHFS